MDCEVTSGRAENPMLSCGECQKAIVDLNEAVQHRGAARIPADGESDDQTIYGVTTSDSVSGNNCSKDSLGGIGVIWLGLGRLVRFRFASFVGPW